MRGELSGESTLSRLSVERFVRIAIGTELEFGWAPHVIDVYWDVCHW